MKAVRIHAFGGPEVLQIEDVPVPEPGAGELRIRVMAAGVNPADWKIRQGGRGTLPMTLGLDVAGVVDVVGEGVTQFRPGDRVFAKVTTEQGAFAEYTVVATEQVALMPRSEDFVRAAAVPTAGLTAWQALFDTADLQPGQTVLIHGAAGGVGSFAVQLAKWKGARVIGTASGEGIAAARRLGADEVIDYTAQRFEEVVHDVDVVLDTIGGDTFTRSLDVLKPGGIIVTLIYDAPLEKVEGRNVRATRIVTQNNGQELAQIAALIDAGAVVPAVNVILPLSAVRRAQEMIAGHHGPGKIVLVVAEEAQHGEQAA
jgi:NADPH:quinone reductase-like Zn-dependent oxidoreductase